MQYLLLGVKSHMTEMLMMTDAHAVRDGSTLLLNWYVTFAEEAPTFTNQEST